MTRVHEVCLARGGNTSRVGFLAGDKKEWSGAHSCHQRSLPSIQAHSLPSACSVEFCLLCCQPEPSLNLCLPGWHRLLYANLAVCKLKGGELSTWRAGFVALLHPSSRGDRMIESQRKNWKPLLSGPATSSWLRMVLPRQRSFARSFGFIRPAFSLFCPAPNILLQWLVLDVEQHIRGSDLKYPCGRGNSAISDA